MITRLKKILHYKQKQWHIVKTWTQTIVVIYSCNHAEHQKPGCRLNVVSLSLYQSDGGVQQTQRVALRGCSIGTLGVCLGLSALRLDTERSLVLRRELLGVRGLRLGLFPTGLDTSGGDSGISGVRLPSLGHTVKAALSVSSV